MIHLIRALLTALITVLIVTALITALTAAFITALITALTRYAVASISRLLKIIGLFCKRALQKRPIFCKETYNFKDPTNHSHPIPYLRL